MGHFYTTLTLSTPDTPSIASALRSRSAFIATPKDNFSVIYDEGRWPGPLSDVPRL